MATEKAAGTIALLYTLVGCLWILFSDQLVGAMFHDLQTIILVSQIKGWVYVGVTALLLHWLIRRYVARLLRSEAALQVRTAALEHIEEEQRQQLIEAEVNQRRLDELNRQLTTLFQATPGCGDIGSGRQRHPLEPDGR